MSVGSMAYHFRVSTRIKWHDQNWQMKNIREVPDSDPDIPILSGTGQWTYIGAIDEGSDRATGDGETMDTAETVETMETAETTDAAQRMTTADAMDSAVTSEQVDDPQDIQNSPDPPDPSNQDPPSSPEQPGLHNSPSSPYMHTSRRRRFNFKEWVANEKRTHELTYKQRISYFHGALSDSEDDDYGEFQQSQSGNGQAEGIDYETDSADDDQSVPVRPKRSQLVLDDSSSDSSSDSESGSSDTASIVTLFTKRLKNTIPASRAIDEDELFPDYLGDSLGDSFLEQSESFPEFGEVFSESGDPLPELGEPPPELGGSLSKLDGSQFSGSLDEAREGKGGGFDYMLPPRPRSKRSNQGKHQMRVTDLVDELGSRAPLALRIAARTARVRSGGGGGCADEPSKKYFAGHNPEGMKVLNKWRSGTLQLERNNPRAPQQKRARTMTSRSSSGHSSARAQPTSTKLQALFEPPKRKRRPQQSRRVTRNYSTSQFPTTVLERQVTPRPLSLSFTHGHTLRSTHSFTPSHESQSHLVASHSPETHNPASHDFPAYRTPSGLSTGTTISVKVRKTSPTRYFDPSLMPLSTFVGSGLLNMLEAPAVWSYPSNMMFGTPLHEANKVQVVSDAEHIYEVCVKSQTTRNTSSLYQPIYQYFLHGVAYLCDESQIVESRFRKLVLHEWIKLARHMLKKVVGKTHLAKSATTLLVVQLTTLAALLVSRRVILLDPNSHDGAKAKHLAIWVIYYLQTHVSKQIDMVHYNVPGQVVGVELAYTAGVFQIYEDLAPAVFTKGNLAANWHFLLLITAVHSPRKWSNWDLARDMSTPENVRVSMEYAQLLMAKWNWPGSVELVTDFFNHYAKQKSYADPRGEKIWLPQFLSRSRFDGSYTPTQDFALFLEILGLTLLKFEGDMQACRRIRGRVTPLSALSFPETEEVSLSDLSSASHQYGVLIVLFRLLPPESRPPISQFRDLVVLQHSHLAIRIKAVSAWEIISHFVFGTQDAEECCAWMEKDILQYNHTNDSGDLVPDSLLHAALKTSCGLRSKQTVPVKALSRLGLRSLNQQIRSLAFYLLSFFTTDLEILDTALEIHDHYTDPDLDAYARLVLKYPQVFYNKTSDMSPIVVGICTRILRLHRSQITHPDMVRIICDILLIPVITHDEEKLLVAADLLTGEEGNSLTQRRKAIRKFMIPSNIPQKEQWEHILTNMSHHLDGMKHNEGQKVHYSPVVVDVRRLAFVQFPELSRVFTFEVSENVKSIENLHRNVQEIVDLIGNMDFLEAEQMFANESALSCYYFFAFKLQRLIDTAIAEARYGKLVINDEKFITEMVEVVESIETHYGRRTYNAVVNHVFTGFFLLAAGNGEQLIGLFSVLPTLLRAAKHLVLAYAATPDVNCMYFLSTVSEYLPMLFGGEYESAIFIQFHSMIFREYFALAELTITNVAAASADTGIVSFDLFIGTIDIYRLVNTMLHGHSTRRFESLMAKKAGMSLLDRGAPVKRHLNDIVQMFRSLSAKMAQQIAQPRLDEIQDLTGSNVNRAGEVANALISRYTNNEAIEWLEQHDHDLWQRFRKRY